MKKSPELKLFKGKLLDFVTKREISSQIATMEEVKHRSQPYIIIGYLLDETPTRWLVGDDSETVSKSIQKADVSSIEISVEETEKLEEVKSSDPFSRYAFSGKS